MDTHQKRKITIMLDADVWSGLRAKVGERKIGTFLSTLARPLVVPASLDEGYKAMSLDADHEQDAQEWIQDGDEVCEAENVWRF